jgi:hypothetical protein
MMVVVNRWEENLVVLPIESTPLFPPSFNTLHFKRRVPCRTSTKIQSPCHAPPCRRPRNSIGIFLILPSPLTFLRSAFFMALRMEQGIRIHRIQTSSLPSLRGLGGRESLVLSPLTSPTFPSYPPHLLLCFFREC